jgi:ketosteroid isomerase-like protein
MRERDKDEIRHCIDQTFRAYINKDLPSLEKTHVVDWVGFRSNSASILKGLNNYLHEVEADFQNLDYLDYEMVDIDYVFYGDICVVPYVTRLRILSQGDKISEIRLRSLEVYQQQNNAWGQIAAHTSLYPAFDDLKV